MRSEKFIDINSVTHRFPEQLRSVGFATTFLRNHPHAPIDSVLVYRNDFTISEYVPEMQVEKYFPCSWFFDNGKPRAYEYSDQSLPFELKQITRRLDLLASKGYLNYGVTERPMRNCTEFQTPTGHIYVGHSSVNRDQIDNKPSETAISGIIKVACHYDCYKNKKDGMIADTRTDPGVDGVNEQHRINITNNPLKYFLFQKLNWIGSLFIEPARGVIVWPRVISSWSFYRCHLINHQAKIITLCQQSKCVGTTSRIFRIFISWFH